MAINKVLVVDDDTAVRRLVCDVLQAYGYSTVAANDGFSALRMMQTEHPDCVILDVMMPGLDGHAVLNRIRESEGGSDLPVVMLTAAADDAQAWKAWTEGRRLLPGQAFQPRRAAELPRLPRRRLTKGLARSRRSLPLAGWW